jgi:hypothetical protein
VRIVRGHRRTCLIWQLGGPMCGTVVQHLAACSSELKPLVCTAWVGAGKWHLIVHHAWHAVLLL